MLTAPPDALLVVSFGAPEGPADVLPFLRNVTRGRDVPVDRLAEVADRYLAVGGVSPLAEQTRALAAALTDELRRRGPALPVYLGNRNWHPLLAGTLATMAADGVRSAAAVFTSPYSSYASCRQYREDIAAAQQAVGAGAPRVEKVRHYFNHPGFVEPVAERARAALAELPDAVRAGAHLAFVAHSIPAAMASCSGPVGDAYPTQLAAVAALVADRLPGAHPWRVVYSSRSGPPRQRWLGPDVLDHIAAVSAAGVPALVLVPIGFISDHMEVVYDLDVAALARAGELGLPVVRAATVGTDPRFVAMVRDLVVELAEPGRPRPALGSLGPSHTACPADCCYFQ